MLFTTALVVLNLISSPVQPPSDDGMVIAKVPEHTIEIIDKTYSEMKPVVFSPPPDRWKNLKHLQTIIRKGGSLAIVNLGDSIVNDTYNSGWRFLVQRDYPKLQLTNYVVVRGSTGCWWYKDNGRIA